MVVASGVERAREDERAQEDAGKVRPRCHPQRPRRRRHPVRMRVGMAARRVGMVVRSGRVGMATWRVVNRQSQESNGDMTELGLWLFPKVGRATVCACGSQV